MSERENSREEPGLKATELPPDTKGMRAFSMAVFFVLGGALVGFIVANPLGLPFLPSGSGPAAPEAASEPAGKDGPAATVEDGDEQVYQCPMHPEVIDTKPGECPICGMDLMPVARQAAEGAEAAGGGKGADSGERKIAYWYAPMDPTYIRNEPGLSPMGMKLVPKYEDEAGSAGEIRIDPVQVQNMGVVSTPVRTEEIRRRSKTVGILDYNAENVTWINTKFTGWIEKVHVNYVGQEVRKGEPLFEIYSPELVTTQEEYLRALAYQRSLEKSGRDEALRQARSLVESSRERLQYWDITEEQIRLLEESRKVERTVSVVAPVDGVIAEVMDEALEGMNVKPGMNLYKIADLSTLWVHAAVYEQDLPWIRAGRSAVVTFRHDAGLSYRGKVRFLYPEVSKETRTLKVCVEIPNPGEKLRPGMYADATILGPPIENALVIPQSSVIRTGERNIVFVDLGDGRYQPREVSLGIRGEGDDVQVLGGVTADERVVTQAQFMFDSESRIQEAIAKFRERSRKAGEPAPEGAGHSH